MSFTRKTMPELLRSKPEDQKLKAKEYNIVVLLDGIRSRQNVGSIFRTADALQVEKIYLCGLTPTPPHRDIQKSALGATESVHWEYAENIAAALQKLIAEGYLIIGIEQVHNSSSLASLDLGQQRKVAIILGNEVDGVSDEALSLCNICVEIDQYGTKHSLNVSVAAGIVLWRLSSAAKSAMR